MKDFPFFSQLHSPIFRSIFEQLWPGKMLAVLLHRGRLPLLLILAAFSLTSCATSVGVQRNDPRETYSQISVSAISADDYSRFSRDVLTRYNLVQAFNEDPLQVLTFLHHEAEKDYRNDLLFALAELNYFVGMRYRHKGIQQPGLSVSFHHDGCQHHRAWHQPRPWLLHAEGDYRPLARPHP